MRYIDVKRVFAAALSIESAEARARYLDEACGDDLPFRKEVGELLIAWENAGSFMQIPAGEVDPRT